MSLLRILCLLYYSTVLLTWLGSSTVEPVDAIVGLISGAIHNGLFLHGGKFIRICIDSDGYSSRPAFAVVDHGVRYCGSEFLSLGLEFTSCTQF